MCVCFIIGDQKKEIYMRMCVFVHKLVPPMMHHMCLCDMKGSCRYVSVCAFECVCVCVGARAHTRAQAHKYLEKLLLQPLTEADSLERHESRSGRVREVPLALAPSDGCEQACGRGFETQTAMTYMPSGSSLS